MNFDLQNDDAFDIILGRCNFYNELANLIECKETPMPKHLLDMCEQFEDLVRIEEGEGTYDATLMAQAIFKVQDYDSYYEDKLNPDAINEYKKLSG